MQEKERIGRITLDYDHNIPPEALPILRNVLAQYESLIPAWCTDLFVTWTTSSRDDQSTIATNSTHYAYRSASIYVWPDWLSLNDRMRRHSMLHEILHIALAPLSDFSRDLFQEIFKTDNVDDGPRSRFIKTQHSERVEQVVSDLTDIILKLEEAGALNLASEGPIEFPVIPNDRSRRIS